ncbi:MAG: Phosphomethylpyrimidine kinase [Labilithrix sp.]|nr:Phosphomethylpyrimidine kinase [Labilithrix sp.]
MATAKKSEKRKLPCVLTIGGLDPGGGAGILADARAVLHAGAFPAAALAVLTVQSTSGMRGATPVARAELIAECTEVVKHQRVRAIKVGALGSDDNAAAVGDFLAIHRDLPAVVDTVMVPTRGRARLLEEKGVAVLRDRVLTRAALVTVNAPEAEVLTGRRVTRLDEAHDAVHALLDLGVRSVLLKGGHLGGKKAVDVLGIAGKKKPDVVELKATRLDLPPFHGGGCVLASLIAGRLAVSDEAVAADLGAALLEAVTWAKKEHHAALGRLRDVGGDLKVLVLRASG